MERGKSWRETGDPVGRDCKRPEQQAETSGVCAAQGAETLGEGPAGGTLLSTSPHNTGPKPPHPGGKEDVPSSSQTPCKAGILFFI